MTEALHMRSVHGGVSGPFQGAQDGCQSRIVFEIPEIAVACGGMAGIHGDPRTVRPDSSFVCHAYPLGLLGNHEREFEVVETQCMVIQLVGICQEAHVFDCVFCLLSVLPCYIVSNTQ